MGISETVLAIRPQEVGRLKVGGLSATKRTSRDGKEWQPPVKFEHFVLTRTVRGKQDNNFIVDVELMKQLAARGCRVADLVDSNGKPKISPIPALVEIPIKLASSVIEDVFPNSLAAYAGKSLYCRGDGSGKEGALRYEFKQGQPTGRSKRFDCVCDLLTNPPKNGPVCKPHGTLWFSVQAGSDTKIGGCHSFRTTSWNSIRAILAGLRQIQEDIGTIKKIPLWLTYSLHDTRRRDGTPTTVQVVGIEARISDLMALQRQLKAEAQSRNELIQLYSNDPMRLALPAPGENESPEEQARIAAEYHPVGVVSGEIIDVIPEDREESIDFDPETGEIREPAPNTSTAPEDPSSGSQQRPSGDQASPKVEPPSIELMEKIGTKLRDLAIARGFDPMNEEEFKGAKKQVFQQIVADYVSEEPVMFKALSRKQAELAFLGLDRELAAIAERDLQEDPGGDQVDEPVADGAGTGSGAPTAAQAPASAPEADQAPEAVTGSKGAQPPPEAKQDKGSKEKKA